MEQTTGINMSFNDVNMTLTDVNLTSNDTNLHQQSSLPIILLSIYFPAIIGVFGIIGNILSFVILLRERNSSTSYLLRCLAVCDTIFLVTAMQIQVTFSIMATYGDQKTAYTMAKMVNIPYIWPVAMAAQMSSVWLTVFISFDRYYAVCNPFKAKSVCTVKTAQRACVCIALGCLLYNIPRFFEYLQINEQGLAEYTSPNKSIIGNDEVYRYLYCGILYFLLLFCIPLVLLLILNMRIICTLNKERKVMPSMSTTQMRERKVTKICLCIVLVFFLCGTLSPITNFQDAIAPQSFQDSNSNALVILMLVSNLLVFINSSVNFLVYLSFGGRFRAQLINMFRCKINLKKGYMRSVSKSSSTQDGSQEETHTMTTICNDNWIKSNNQYNAE